MQRDIHWRDFSFMPETLQTVRYWKSTLPCFQLAYREVQSSLPSTVDGIENSSPSCNTSQVSSYKGHVRFWAVSNSSCSSTTSRCCNKWMLLPFLSEPVQKGPRVGISNRLCKWLAVAKGNTNVDGLGLLASCTMPTTVYIVSWLTSCSSACR